MKQNKKIAVTGGIGSGKSTVCAILRDLGYPVFSCDEIYRELCEEQSFLQGLSNLFPDCVSKDGLNKQALSLQVFSNKDKLEKLNAYTHPLIYQRLIEKMQSHEIAFAEVPLLFESKMEHEFDGVIAIRRNNALRIHAVKERDGLDEEQIISRIKTQFPQENYCEKNCVIIENEGNLAQLTKKIEQSLPLLGI